MCAGLQLTITFITNFSDDYFLDELMNCFLSIVYKMSEKNILFNIMYDAEKLYILTFEKLQPANIWLLFFFKR